MGNSVGGVPSSLQDKIKNENRNAERETKIDLF